MRQQVMPNGFLEIPSKQELSEAVGHHFSDFIRDFYRGVDYIEIQGNASGSSTFTTVSIGDSGYAWSVRLISVQCSAAAQISVYPGENTNVAPIATEATTLNGSNNEAVFWFSNESAVYKDQRVFTILASAGNILTYRIKAKQVPVEMQGKL
jgi:hypothetical protein